MGTPAFEKDNAATRMFQRVQQLRSEMGSRGSRGLPPADTVPQVDFDVRNVPLDASGNIQPMISPLSPEEIERRNQEWERQTGQRLDSNNNILIGDAVDPDVDVPAADPWEGRPHPSAGMMNPALVQAQRSAIQQFTPGPRPIDFTKLQSINPVEGVVIVDGISFKMTDSEKGATAVLLVNIVQRAMQDQILVGLRALGLSVSAPGEATDGAPATAEGMPALSEAGEAGVAPAIVISPEQVEG